MAKTKTELKMMTKVQLEEYGRSIGIEVDRRLKKDTLIQQLMEYEAPPQVISSVKTRSDRVSLSSGEVEEFLNTLPPYHGKNGGEISTVVMKNLHLFSGHHVTFGPTKNNKGYALVVKGPDINKTFKL